ncbi:MAG: response regulator transcription factor, partial [Burkholderiales bacterium]
MGSQSSEPISIVIADDHPMFREGVARTLAGAPDIEVVGEAANADEAFARVTETLPDVVLLDISMPGGGLEAARRISAAFPVVRIAMLTVSEDDDDVLAALEIGARGYVLKGIGGMELVDVVRAIHRGESYVSPDLAGRILSEMRRAGDKPHAPQDHWSQLNSREEGILRHVAQGMSNKEIGRALGLQEKTVKHYMTNILQKL